MHMNKDNERNEGMTPGWKATIRRNGRWHHMITLRGPNSGDYWTVGAFGKEHANRKARRILARWNLRWSRCLESWDVEDD